MTARHETSPRAQRSNTIGAVMFVLVAMAAGFVAIGWPPVGIVGGSGVAEFTHFIYAIVRLAAADRRSAVAA